MNQPGPADRVGNQAQKARLAEIVIQAKRRAKDAATLVSPGPGHRLHGAGRVGGGEQYGRVRRETRPA